VTHTELVKHVRVCRGEIGDCEFAQNEPFEHRLVNNATGHFLIGAQRFEACLANRRRDEFLINRVKIDLCAAGTRLLAKRHQNKTEGALGQGGLRCTGWGYHRRHSPQRVV